MNFEPVGGAEQEYLRLKKDYSTTRWFRGKNLSLELGVQTARALITSWNFKQFVASVRDFVRARC